MNQAVLRLKLLVLAGVLLLSPLARASDTPHYYYCEPTASYFPYTKTCPIPWREVSNINIAVAAPPPASVAPVPAPDAVSPPALLTPAVLTTSAAPAAVPQAEQRQLVDESVVFPFDRQIPTIVCAVHQLCDLALQSGEQVNSVMLGDPERWKIDEATEGSGPSATQHLIIKPLDADLDTSVIVMTKTRTYHLRLKSDRSTYMLQIAFSYPEATVAKAIAEQAVKETVLPKTEEAVESDLVHIQGVSYIKGREPKMLGSGDDPVTPEAGIVKVKATEPPLPDSAPRPQVDVHQDEDEKP
jgi:hypothetical protein